MADNGEQWILSADGKPFADFKSASFMRDQLNQTSPDYAFVIIEHPRGGYAIQRVERERPPSAATAVSPHGVSMPSHGHQSQARDPLQRVSEDTRRFVATLPIVLRPALRNYIVRMFVVLVLFFVAFTLVDSILFALPRQLLGVIFKYVSNIQSVMFWGFIGLGFYHLMVILFNVYSKTYTITKDGIRSTFGIVSRDSHAVRYRDIRAVALEQGLFERLFNVGTIEFFTAGSSGADVIFEKIANPSVLRDYLEEYSNAFYSSGD